MSAQRHSSLIMPLEDADPHLFGSPADRAVSPRTQPLAATTVGSSPAASPALQLRSHPNNSSKSSSSPPFVSEASLDFQRNLLQQQLQQAQREMERLKGELGETTERLSDTRQQLNEQKASYTSLTHRYSATVEKLTGAESDVKALEGQLVKERSQRHHLQSEREEQRLAQREQQWEMERLQRQLQQLEANRGLDPKEVQRTLEDRAQYIPTVEVRRVQTEMQNTHQALVERLLTSLEALTVSNEESQTNLFVARSAVLSAATDIDARLQRAEAGLDDVHQQWTSYRETVEAETHEFLLAVMSENKELWQQLTLLQSEYDVVAAEAQLRSTQGSTVTAEEHAYAQRQLEVMTERLGKAQQLVESQTILARAHEEGMAELLEANDAMQRRIEELEAHQREQEGALASKAAALTEADVALRDAAAQIEELHDTLAEERQRAAAMASEMKATQCTLQEEYDGRLRQLEHDCSVAENTSATLQHTLEETAAKLDTVERNLAARSRDYDALRQATAQEASSVAARHAAEQQRVQAAMDSEMAALRTQLEEAQQAARAAARQRDDAVARESAFVAAHRTLEHDTSEMRQEVEGLRRQVKESAEQRQRLQGELDELRASHGEGSTLAVELQRRNELLQAEKAELTASLQSEKARQEQRYTALHTDWRTSEKARAALQEEVKTLRTRCADLETSTMAQERQTQDKEQLMRENLRLHEQYQLIQRECTTLREEAKALRQRGEGDAQWTRQMDDLQRRLRELPELRLAADAARRDALTAKEETELLRRERDQLAVKLDTFLEDAKAQSRREDDFERVCREASAAAQRVGGIVSSAKESSTRYHVFRNTNPTGRGLSAGAGGAGVSGGTPRAASGSATVSLSRTAPQPPQQQQQLQHRSPVRLVRNDGDVSVTTVGSGAGRSPRAVESEGAAVAAGGSRSAASSPSRPWH